TADGRLGGVQGRTKLRQFGKDVQYTEDGENWIPIDAGSLVSLNTWGFTPSFFDELEARFPVFLRENAERLDKAEYFLPDVVNQLLREGRAAVKVLPVNERWFGVTYPDDRPIVQNAIRDMVARGLYPEQLW